MLKVLHVSKYYHPHKGGIESFIYDLHNSSAYCVDSDIVFFHNRNYQYKNLLGFKIEFRLGKQPISFRAFFWLLCNARNYDLIHFHYPNPFLAFPLIFTKTSLVIHWHCDIVVGGILRVINKPFDFLLRLKARKIIVTSPNYLAFSSYLLPFKSKCDIIPIGINLNKLVITKPIDEKPNKNFDNTFKVLSVGRLTEYKGFDFLIQAMIFLPKNVVLDIVGSGELRPCLIKKINELKLASRIRLHTQVSDIELYEFYSKCDVFVLPSVTKNEAFGIVQLEAFYFGKPVISTKIKGSGVDWVNKHNETGVIVNTKDSKALALAIEKIRNGFLLSNNNSEYVKKEFSIDVVASKIIRSYDFKYSIA
jgi:glycosyltransferase involved in cell wall biosynthesis